MERWRSSSEARARLADLLVPVASRGRPGTHGRCRTGQGAEKLGQATEADLGALVGERLDPAEKGAVGTERQGLVGTDSGEGDGQVRAWAEAGTAHDGAQVHAPAGGPRRTKARPWMMISWASARSSRAM